MNSSVSSPKIEKYYQDNHFLWSSNTPAQFWQVEEELDPRLWEEAIKSAIKETGFPIIPENIDHFLDYTLGEGRFGNDHWNLSTFNKIYWKVKHYVPKPVTRRIKKLVNTLKSKSLNLPWPIEDSYANFLWEALRQVMQISSTVSVKFKNFWPEQKKFALVLTHDVETIQMQSFIPVIADLEEKFGFRSSFNIVGEQIPKEPSLFNELLARGFEVGIHGWKHNEKAFQSRSSFLESAKKINECLENTGAVGMRFPLNLRNPYWMQDLNIDYDLSFFDTDPFEPIPGGTMSIWPFFIGHFVELPTTLVQDNTLVNHLGENSPDLWLNKVEFIKKYHGMALLNSHPDYLIDTRVWKVYERFLGQMTEHDSCWHGLPRETARWWRSRSENNTSGKFQGSNMAEAILSDGKLEIINTN
jgi:peptidoglycan/xylan/chitin deacetylase (PgdA/CDA1 family)